MSIFDVITLLGGLAMFLYGMEIMGDGLKKSSGSALKTVLGKMTKNVLTGALTGMLVTGVIQSSTATIVLTVGLIGAGILNLKQGASIVLGANIGTTITAQIIRLMDVKATGILQVFQPKTLAPIALIIGIILTMFIKSNNKGTGEIFIGFGVLFVGLMTMTGSVEALDKNSLSVIMEKFSDIPVLGILTGFVLTIIVQSSSAVVGMLQALSSTGSMTFDIINPIVMGINLGTCVTTAMVCSIGSSKDAKRTGVIHIVFNVIGTLLFMLALYLLKTFGAFPNLWGMEANSGVIANFQTIFNLVTAILLLPFTNLLVKLSMIVIKPDKEEEETYPELNSLDDKLFVSPTLAIAQAANAIAVMGSVARSNLKMGRQQLLEYDENRAESLSSNEERIDAFADSADNYLVKLSKFTDNPADNREINLLMQTTTDFERIGDYATNMDELAEKMKQEGNSFSDTAKQELKLVSDAVLEIINLTVTAFKNNDEALAEKVEPLEEVIDDIVLMLKNRHIERLKKGECTISAGLVFMETLTYLERASDQCSSIAVLILARTRPEIAENHHEYLREVHKGGSEGYRNEIEKRREQYLNPIEALQNK